MNKLVSVIIPCFKYAHMIRDALDSIRTQEYPTIETIVVDDGSPDSSSETILDYQRCYPEMNLVLIRHPNSGPPGARNRGIAASQGEFILPLDADDKIHPSMISKMVKILENDDRIGVAYCDVQRFGDDQNIVLAGDFDLFRLLDFNQIPYCSLYRKQCWIDVNGYRKELRIGYDDWAFWIDIARSGWKGQRHSDALFYYRKHGTSAVTGAEKHKLELWARIIQERHMHYPIGFESVAKRILELHESGQNLSDVKIPPTSAMIQVFFQFALSWGFITDINQKTIIFNSEQQRIEII